MASTEKETQKACLDYLVASRIFHYRNNSGAMVSEYKGKKRFMRFGANGSPDIIVVFKGQYIGFEIKDKAGEQSDSQIKFQESLEKAGGAYHLIRSIDEFLKIMMKYKNL